MRTDVEDPRSRQRPHSTDGFDSHDHHGHHHAQAFYQVPLRRHVWGEPQYELHPGGHDLGGPNIIKKIADHWASVM